MYSYCQNNPVMRVDENGYFWNIVAGAVIGGDVGGIIELGTQLLKQEDVDWSKVGVAALSGAISGGLVASGVGVIGQTIGGGLINAVTDVGMQIIDISKNGGNYDWKQTVIAGGMGALTGAAGGKGLGKNTKISGAKNALKQLRNEEAFLIKSGRYLETVANLDVMSATRQNLVNTTVKEFSKTFGTSALGSIGTNVIVFDYNLYFK